MLFFGFCFHRPCVIYRKSENRMRYFLRPTFLAAEMLKNVLEVNNVLLGVKKYFLKFFFLSITKGKKQSIGAWLNSILFSIIITAKAGVQYMKPFSPTSIVRSWWQGCCIFAECLCIQNIFVSSQHIIIMGVSANEPWWVKIQTPAISTKTSSKDTQNQPNNKIKGRDRVVLIRSIVYRDTRDNYRIMIYLPSHTQVMRFSSSCLKSHSTLSQSHIYIFTYI